APDADRAQRVAVVALRERDELALLRLAPLLPVLERHLQRDFHGCAAVVRIEDLGEAALARRKARPGSARYELRRQLDRWRRGEPEQRRVRHVLELQADGAVDLWPVVAMHGGPQGRDRVEILAPAGVEDPGAARVLDDHRLVARQRLDPGLHLREGMPEMRAVQGREALVARFGVLDGFRDLTHRLRF